jgi:S1-C subfamily serine protease
VALSESVMKQHGLAGEAGLLIVSIADGSPAEKAGMMLGDVLLEANGSALSGPDDLLDALSGVPKKGVVTVKFLRGGTIKSAAITPADRGERE